MRKIIHIDMDCFYAAVEMRDFPDLADKPIAVGGEQDRRGVLTTCNYQARRYGLRSAMPTHQAKKLCPQLILRPVRMAVYKEESKEIHKIFRQYTDVIEPLSLDEAYLDVSNCQEQQGSATWIAAAIRKQIFKQRGLTASAGIAPNKSLAKIASDWHKPNGQKVIQPSDIDAFMKDLSVRKLFGVGPKMADKLKALNVETCGQLQTLPLNELQMRFGKQGKLLYQLSRGIDHRPVESLRVRKSISVEQTFPKDIHSLPELQSMMPVLLERLKSRQQTASSPLVQGVFVKIKFSDFKQTTVEKAGSQLSLELFTQLLAEGLTRHLKPVRLLGLGLRCEKSGSQNSRQLELPLSPTD
jgi:DNA polymerase-4